MIIGMMRRDAHIVKRDAREAVEVGGADGARIGKGGRDEDEQPAEHRRVRRVLVPLRQARVGD